MITVIKQPLLFQPSGNPVVFQFSTDNANLVYFKFELRKDSDIISVLDLYPTPANPTSAFLNLSSILSSYVKHEFKGYSDSLVDYFIKPVFNYNYRITERIISGGLIVDGANYDAVSSKYVFNGDLDSISFKSYDINRFVVNNLFQLKFLTSKPDRTIVNDYSNEGLFFLQNNYANPVYIHYEFFNAANVSIASHLELLPLQSTMKQYRVNTSPKFLKEAIATFDYNLLSHFKVRIVDSLNTLLSETKTYIYQNLSCHLFPVSIIWVNKYGALDTIQLYQPEQTLNVTKNTIKHNPLKFDSSGNLNDYNGNVFNVVEEIINTTTERTIKLNTAPLSDAEQNWISGVVNSRQIYLQADTDLYIPVSLVDSSFNIKGQKYMSEPNIKSFTFKFSNGFTPDVDL